ncbi:MAG: biotin--[acetyl-CoA-carboxylase] ligase [Treponema sp.]|nr:biotin--[acetyl-CoA-carboxylase] ligase [Treponema sp.]
MKSLALSNPFNAPVFHMDTVSSTMDISRKLEAEGKAHGTVITADFQNAGRGRGLDKGKNRIWEMQKGVNLPFTMLLRYSSFNDIPPALTLRAGLAVSLAIEDFVPSLQGNIKVKWPNDVMIGAKKAAGIICEADGGTVHLGIGINVAQKKFSAHLQEKAVSIAIAAGLSFKKNDRFVLLEKVLMRLYDELNDEPDTEYAKNWKPRLEKRLYKIGEQVTFIEGGADSGKEIKGCLFGIGDNGELLVIPKDKEEPRSFITGELVVY